MKKTTLAVTVLVFCSLSFAEIRSAASVNHQQQAKAALAKKDAAGAVASSLDATNVCSYNFTSGVNNTFLQYCVTVNGNIVQLESPQGHIQIRTDTHGEGYGLCDLGGQVDYSDYGDVGTSANWNPAILLSQSGISVKIGRTTSDGIWTLTQTITQVSKTTSIKVVMALKNNSSIARGAYILRYADADADGLAINNLDGTHNTAMAWTSTSVVPGFGFTLQNVGSQPFTYDGFAQNISNGPVPCHYGVHFTPGVLTETDGSLVLVYIGTVPAKGTRTFNMMYKGL